MNMKQVYILQFKAGEVDIAATPMDDAVADAVSLRTFRSR